MPHSLFSRLADSLRTFAYVSGLSTKRCTVCGTPYATPHAATESGAPAPPALCPECADALKPRRGGYCSRCGLLFADETLPPAPCAACLKTPPLWDSLTFVTAYDKECRHSILRFKFHNALELGAVLGDMLARRCLETVQVTGKPDAVVPIPLHHNRLRERGYNQTLELARPVARALDAPLLHLLHRTAATPHQIGLSREQRRKNLNSVFKADADVAGKTVLLVDDIMTTGATIQAAVQSLTNAGTKAVHVAVVARTPDNIAK